MNEGIVKNGIIHCQSVIASHSLAHTYSFDKKSLFNLNTNTFDGKYSGIFQDTRNNPLKNWPGTPRPKSSIGNRDAI